MERKNVRSHAWSQIHRQLQVYGCWIEQTRRQFGWVSRIAEILPSGLSTPLLRKGVFPYDHINSLEKLKETRLPSKEAFYSKLNDEHISEEDYQHAQKVWDTFKMKTMREYHDLYLKGALDNFSLIPRFFQKNWDFHTIRSVYLCSDCMLNLTCTFNLITKICTFFLQRPFSKVYF